MWVLSLELRLEAMKSPHQTFSKLKTLNIMGPIIHMNLKFHSWMKFYVKSTTVKEWKYQMLLKKHEVTQKKILEKKNSNSFE